MWDIPLFLDSKQYFFISHMISPTDLFRASPAPHFKTFQVFLQPLSQNTQHVHARSRAAEGGLTEEKEYELSQEPHHSATYCRSFHLSRNLFTQFFLWAAAPREPGPPYFRDFTHTHTHTPLGRTPLDKWSVEAKDLYLTTHNTHNRQTSMPPARFESTIPASERQQTHTLDRAASGIYLHNRYWTE
jgi:hypothetical protein